MLQRRARQIEYVTRFEHVITTVLVVMMAVVTVLATLDVAWVLIRDFLSAPLALLDIHEIVEVFGMFLLVLIGLELLETVRTFAREAVLRAELIVLVAIIALARKIITLGLSETSPDMLLGTAAVLVGLGITYFLVRKTHPNERESAEVS